MPRVSSVPAGAGVSTRLFRRAARHNKTLIALGIPADAQRRQEQVISKFSVYLLDLVEDLRCLVNGKSFGFLFSNLCFCVFV